jgi:hypothetical protein
MRDDRFQMKEKQTLDLGSVDLQKNRPQQIEAFSRRQRRTHLGRNFLRPNHANFSKKSRSAMLALLVACSGALTRPRRGCGLLVTPFGDDTFLIRRIWSAFPTAGSALNSVTLWL